MATSPSGISERYPIGPPDRHPGAAQLPGLVTSLRDFPGKFSAVYAGLGDVQLDTPYREGGWTLRQLAHHVADSHTHAYLRMKMAIVEDWPTIQPYDENLWAKTAEVGGSVAGALALLAPLHARIAGLFDSLDERGWARGYIHPENGPTSLAQVAALYSWHGRHHLAHAANLKTRRGW